jgi:hypothetical protein
MTAAELPEKNAFISSIWLFGNLHEYICMSKLGDLLEDRYYRCVPIL